MVYYEQNSLQSTKLIKVQLLCTDSLAANQRRAVFTDFHALTASSEFMITLKSYHWINWSK